MVRLLAKHFVVSSLMIMGLATISCSNDQQELEELQGDEMVEGEAGDQFDDEFKIDELGTEVTEMEPLPAPPPIPEGELQPIIAETPPAPPPQPQQFPGISGDPAAVQAYLSAAKRVYYVTSLLAPTFAQPDTQSKPMGSYVRGEHILAPVTATGQWAYIQPGVYIHRDHLTESFVPRFEPQAQWRQPGFWQTGH